MYSSKEEPYPMAPMGVSPPIGLTNHGEVEALGLLCARCGGLVISLCTEGSTCLCGMEQCFKARLREICVSRFAKHANPPPTRVEVSFNAEGSLHCDIGHEQRKLVKSSNLQLRNTLLQRCEPSVLPVQPPSPGTSSLPIDALLRSAGGSSRSWRFEEFISKLERNATVRIVAVGASNTAMFAEGCSGGGGRKACTIEANMNAASLAERLAERAHKLGKMPGADWLSRFVRIVHARHPGAAQIVRTIGYGGCVRSERALRLEYADYA